MDFKELKEADVINLIYQARAEKIDEILKNVDEKLKGRVKTVEIKRIIEDSNCEKQLTNELNKIEDNYNMKITEYNKEMYKQGFIDGVNLILNCLKD